MDTTCHNDPWSSLYALLICPILHRTVNSYISASRSCCSASNARRFFNSIDADTITHDRMLLEYRDDLLVDNSEHSELWPIIIIIIIIITVTMVWLLKCIIEPLMCGETIVAMTEYCDNIMVTYMDEYCDTRRILWQCHWVPWNVFIITSPFLIWSWYSSF